MRIRKGSARFLAMMTWAALALPGAAAAQQIRKGDGPLPALTVGNLLDKGVVHSGFLIGTATGTAGGVAVTVSLDDGPFMPVALDGGPFRPATATVRWRFKFPTGPATWKENSAHTIVVRASDRLGNVVTRTLNVRKGNNQDVNGDGFADALVGGPTFDNNRGRVYLFFSSGPKGVPTNPVIDENNSTPLQHVIGGEFGAGEQRFGASVALADVNGDGLADLIVGAPAAAGGAGRAYVFYPFRSPDPNGVTLPGNATGTSTQILGDLNHPGFGTSVTGGDVNGDGLADVIVGAIGSATQEGRVYVFQAQFVNGDPAQSGIMQPTVFTADTAILGETRGSNFGQAVALGDVNGDQFGDVIVGANGGARGDAYVFHSTQYGLRTTGVEGSVPTLGVSSADTHIAGEDASQFGTAVGAGDVNGDGFPDLLVGGPTFGGNRGRVYLFYSSGIKGIPTEPVIDENNGTPGQHVIGGEFGDGDQLFGASLALGDINGDGLAELAVGAPAGSAGAGRAYVFYPFRSTDPDGVTLPGNGAGTSTRLFGDSAHPGFGASIATADVNGDGFPDLLGGAPARVPASTTSLGRAYIFHSVLNPQGVQTINPPTVFGADTVITGEPGGSFGASIAR